MGRPTHARMNIPVFLPGNNRGFTEVRGVATITPDGRVEILLQNAEHAMGLAEMQKQGKIISLSFDYLNDPDRKPDHVEQIGG